MSTAAALAELDTLKARRRASLEQCIDAIDSKPAHVFLTALRGELAAVVAIWDAEDALKAPAAAAAVTNAPAAKTKATAPAPKKARHWLRALLPT